jgi:hypothetical protein
VLPDGGPPRALRGDPDLRRLEGRERPGEERLQLLRHRCEDGRRQLRRQARRAWGPVAHKRLFQQPQDGDPRRLDRRHEPRADALDAQGPALSQAGAVAEVREHFRLPCRPAGLRLLAGAAQRGGVDAFEAARLLPERGEVEHARMHVQKGHEPAVVGLCELAREHPARCAGAAGARGARARARLHAGAELVAERDEALNDAAVARDERERGDRRVGNLDKVVRPVAPERPGIAGRKGAMGRDVAELVVPRPKARDPGDRGVVELPPARQVQVPGEAGQLRGERADAVGLGER